MGAAVRWAAAVLALPLLAGCDDLTLNGGGAEVAAVAILDAQGAVLASASALNVVTGDVRVAPGTQRTLRVELRDRTGRVVAPPAGSSAEVSVVQVLIADFATDGPFTGRLVGHATGTTSLRVDYFVDGRREYTSPFIPVVVQ